MGVFSKFLKAAAARLGGRGRDQWDNVKYPDFATDPGRDLTSAAQNPGSEWIDAPATSHVHSFKYQDSRQKGQSRFLKTFLANAPSAGRSILSVRFKPSGRFGVVHYEYYFSNAEVGRLVFDAMRLAAHPGEIVHFHLIRQKVPYRKVS